MDRHIPLPLGDQQPDTDEDYSEYFEDYGLRVAEIQEKDKELTVVFHFWSSEYNLGEWDFEKDYHRFFHILLTLYGCKASIVKGAEETPQWAATFQFHKGTVKETSFDPLAESVGYQNVLENLVDINPEKYLPFLVESMKHQIECIQERLDWAQNKLDSNHESPSISADDIPF